MPITIYKRHNSKPNNPMKKCPLSPGTVKVEAHSGNILISFTSGTVNRACDYGVRVHGEELKALILQAAEALADNGKDLHGYTKEELLQAYNDKIKEEV